MSEVLKYVAKARGSQSLYVKGGAGTWGELTTNIAEAMEMTREEWEARLSEEGAKSVELVPVTVK